MNRQNHLTHKFYIMKKNYIFYLAILICYTSFAQAPDFEWQETYGGTGSEYAYSVKQTPDGGYITAGYTNSTDLEVVGNTGGQAFWVLHSAGRHNGNLRTDHRCRSGALWHSGR